MYNLKCSQNGFVENLEIEGKMKMKHFLTTPSIIISDKDFLSSYVFRLKNEYKFQQGQNKRCFSFR